MRAARRLAAAALAAAAAVCGPAGAAPALDVSTFVALGDGLTAGFVNGTLFDGGTAEPFLGQRTSCAVRLAASLGATLDPPLVAYPGRPGRNLLQRKAGVCRFSALHLAATEVQGTGGRTDPSRRATLLAVPGHRVADAVSRPWVIDPSDAATIDTDEDMVLGVPWAAEGAPPRSQLATALALRPTFAMVWLGTEDALRPAREGTTENLTSRKSFADSIEKVVGDLDAAGARGVVATVPDVTVMPYFVRIREVRDILAEVDGSARKDIPPAVLKIFLGLWPRGRLVRKTIAFQEIGEILGGDGRIRPPLPDEVRLTPLEVDRIRARTRSWNASIRATAARHGWAVADVAATFESWRRRSGVQVGGAKLTTDYLGGLFDLDGRSLSPTAQALVAEEFAKAVDARFGTSHAAIDAAAVLRDDPLAPCASGALRGR